jgi:hypothetical protein
MKEFPKVYIKFSHNQVGMLIEASTDKQNWQVVELQKYTLFPSVSYAPYNYSPCVMSTDKQERAYLDSLDAKKIDYEVVRS